MRGEGVDLGSDDGLWAHNAQGELTLIVREGETLQFHRSGEVVSKTVGAFAFAELGTPVERMVARVPLMTRARLPSGSVHRWHRRNLCLGRDRVADPILGVYNGDGSVDAADYTAWRDNLGGPESSLAGIGDGSGTVDAGDYVLWRQNYGRISAGGPTGILLATPEPPTILVGGLLFVLLYAHRRGRSFAAHLARCVSRYTADSLSHRRNASVGRQTVCYCDRQHDHGLCTTNG